MNLLLAQLGKARLWHMTRHDGKQLAALGLSVFWPYDIFIIADDSRMGSHLS
jgi:hypothetical protein